MRLIDADAFVKYLENEIRLMEEDGASSYALMIANGAINDVGRQPTIEPKRGEWKLFYESKDGDNVYKCSCCRFLTVIPEGIKLFSFCPNCGADIRKGAADV